jgi:hypothetical protein
LPHLQAAPERAAEEGWSQTHEDVEVGCSLALTGDEDCAS